jgi:hypothetical protein
MKKNFLGIAAVIIAISASAFTAPKSGAFSNLYRFDGTVAEMHNASKYVSISTPPSSGCQNTNVRPCYIAIDEPVSDWLNDRPTDAEVLQDAAATKN